jgi:hypothetical protein
MRSFVLVLAAAGVALAGTPRLEPFLELHTGSPIGQLRAAPVSIPGGPAFLLAYGEDFDIDPYHEMFFYPKGTLKLAVVNGRGKMIWKRDLGRAVVPGIWFCPVFPFDLDGDGVDEIWFVNNVDPDHPLTLKGLRLERVDARDGKTLGQWDWPIVPVQTPSHTYRQFIFGGHVKGQPVLVTAQGTYGEMALQAWNPAMTRRWEHRIPAGKGPRGSHMTPVIDFDGDGVDEILWGERRIELGSGKQVWCADCDVYNGHSDIIAPFLDWDTGEWRFFTCRESDPRTKPRLAAFDAGGRRLWGDVDQGHMDQGWVAKLGPTGQPVAMGVRIQQKTLGPSGRFRAGVEQFAYDAVSGKRRDLPFDAYLTIPVDLDGDGRHELVRGAPGGDGKVLDGNGKEWGDTGGTSAMMSKFLDLPGEQLLVYYPDGTIRVWADRNARDNEAAKRRYAHPYYKANQRQTGNGYNYVNLGGL